MAFIHGVSTNEAASQINGIITADSCLPLVIGTAPVNTLNDGTARTNQIFLCSSFAEAKEKLGYEAAVPLNDNPSVNGYRYTISEFMYTWFTLYGASKALFINVFDPTRHKTTAETSSITIDAKTGMATINELGLLAGSLAVNKTDDGGTYTVGVDYTATFDDNGRLIVTSLKDESGRFKLETGTPLTISAEKADPGAVTADDIIGGYDALTKQNTGLELINDVKSRFGLIPTVLLAPGFSGDPEVATVMSIKARSINGIYNAVTLIDLPTEEITEYSEAVAWKNDNSVTRENQYLLWPLVRMGDDIYHYSCHMAGLIFQTDAANGGVPFESPSNKLLSCNGLCLQDGTGVFLGLDNANSMNEQGITTAINEGGFRAWGNRTACYPDNNDTKDNFLCVKRMFYWISNSVATNMLIKVDRPGNRSLIDMVVNSIQIWFNSLVSTGSLLYASITFPADKNTVDELLQGHYHFEIQITPPTPAEALIFTLQLNTDGYNTLANSATA